MQAKAVSRMTAEMRGEERRKGELNLFAHSDIHTGQGTRMKQAAEHIALSLCENPSYDLFFLHQSNRAKSLSEGIFKFRNVQYLQLL